MFFLIQVVLDSGVVHWEIGSSVFGGFSNRRSLWWKEIVFSYKSKIYLSSKRYLFYMYRHIIRLYY